MGPSVALYDGEVRWVDYYVSRLLDSLSPLDDDTVVVTSDHGELLGEWGIATHKFLLSDSVTNVPLIVFNADRLGIRPDTKYVQHIDLMQTILDRAGASTEQFEGINLAREVRSRAFMQRKDYADIFERYPAHDPSKYHTGQVDAVRTDEFKLLVSDDRRTLYDLPDENADVSAAHPETVQQLEAKLDGWRATIEDGIRVDAEAELTDGVKRQLEDLGYR